MPEDSSAATDKDWKYRLPNEPNDTGWLRVSDIHEIYWHEYGNPAGEPVMFLHGGPGGGSSIADTRFFDPVRYRIILFDQRGCGRGRPHAKDDPKAALTDNTTSDLIEDIERLREKLEVKGIMQVFGGSWGSTLALAYAIQHPTHVATLILRGIFLCRKPDLDYFYQGNAATYDPDKPYDIGQPGAYIAYPEAWKDFVTFINSADRDDMMKAYADIFANPDHPKRLDAIKAWSVWEGLASYLAPGDRWKDFGDPKFAAAIAMIENHYVMNGGFLGGSGPHNRNNNYLLENAGKIAALPTHIVQGRFDQVCPRFQADALAGALRKAGTKKLNYVLTPAGHSARERENMRELTYIMDYLPRLTQNSAGEWVR